MAMAMAMWMTMAMALTVCELCANLNKFEVCFCLRAVFFLCTLLGIRLYFLLSHAPDGIKEVLEVLRTARPLAFLIEFFQYYLNSTTRAQIIIVDYKCDK